jgi:hypothetical protein
VSDPAKRLSSDAFQRAVQEIADCVRPISVVESGSGGRKFIGSAVVIATASKRVVVTANHVIAGPEGKLIGMSSDGSIRWPSNYSRVEPVGDLAPPVDLAFIVAEVESQNPFDILPALPAGNILPGQDFPAGTSLIAVGFPASRAKSRDAQTRLRTHRMSVVGDLASESVHWMVNRDPVSFLCMEFRQDRVFDTVGSPATASHPRGMSGGALFAAAFLADGESVRYTPRLVGILIEYHDEPANVIVAARIDCLLEATGSRPNGAPPRYHSADV